MTMTVVTAKVELMVALMAVQMVETVTLVILMTVPVMVIAAPSLGLAMVLPIVKIRHMAVI